MPNTKSGKKRMRQSEGRRLTNRAVKHGIKNQIRKVRAAIAKNVDEADAELKTLAKKVDKASAHGVIHGNTAARVKSRLSAVVKAAKATAKS